MCLGILVRHQIWEQCRAFPGKMWGWRVLESQHSSPILPLFPRVSSTQLSHKATRAKPFNDVPQSKRPLNLRGNCWLPWTCRTFCPCRYNVITLQIWASLSGLDCELPVYLLWRHRSAPMMSWLSCSCNGRCLSVSLSLMDGDQLLSWHVRNKESRRFCPPTKRRGWYKWKWLLRIKSLTCLLTED